MGAKTRGTIPDDGVVSLLRDLEDSRSSGLLVFRAKDGSQGEVWMRLGQIDPSQPEGHDGSDPVERFLGVRGGEYEILERLPPLDDSEGTDRIRTGSLGRHTVADLMNYAESAGLCGLLRVEHEGRAAEIVYVDGALTQIYLDGGETDVDQVFAWAEGRFVIRVNGAPSMPPPGPAGAPRPAPVVVERNLGELLDQAANRRPRPPSTYPARARSVPPPRREATVRIVLLGGGGEALLSIDPAKARLRPVVVSSSDVEPAPRGSIARPTSPRLVERRTRGPSRVSTPEPEPVVPRVALALLVVLLLLGIGAFVASLLSIG